ncbi:MAG: hypothetical protein M8467_17185 [Anaerolineae bacterium]|nr:hypothetical protein [Anaerolineae bacterium]
MKNRAIFVSLGLAFLILGLSELALTAPAREEILPSRPASSAEDDPSPSLPGSQLSSQETRPAASPGALPPRAAAGVLDVFTNTWSYSTIGLVYVPGRGSVRYAHESQSSTSNPTIYDVGQVSHTPLSSIALSAQNSGWPWQVDNRTGAAYDFTSDTYFLPDYNGDLSYADDNLVEIDPDGNILNAWEMDDEVGSNDSSDGSAIDSIIDIAVVPGTPPRYFVTAAYDGAVVYEIALTKTGVWWTPNSWQTVMTYSVGTVFQDNLGIDWDAEHEVLFHSGWHTTTILVTDLGMNPITEVPATFDCPGAGGYNSGVTYIEGSNPSQVWVTDFSSDVTTICDTPFTPDPPEPGWQKLVEGEPWAAGQVLATETGDTFQVTDVITAVQAYTLTETWNPDHLQLVDVQVLPSVATIITTPQSLDIVVPAGPPEVVTVVKWFYVQPCNWTSTILEEYLLIEGGPAFDPRNVSIEKQPPELWIESSYEPEVDSGGLAMYTLTYSNTGGYENSVWISNTFPIEAPIVFAEPFPDAIGPGGSWARWDTGDLSTGAKASIDVYVLISETVATSSTITIWGGIFDHMDQLRGETSVEFHATQAEFMAEWNKTIDGLPWEPGLAITRQTSQTLTVIEVIAPSPDNPTGFNLIEEWNPAELALVNWSVEPATYEPHVLAAGPDVWNMFVPPDVDLGPATVTKEFHVEPCIWGETILWETLATGDFLRNRPVVVVKQPPELWIDSQFDENVHSGKPAEFLLAYGNHGGFENQAWIRSDFPPEAPFAGSDPPPVEVGPEGLWALWEVGDLATDDSGGIAVMVEIAPGLLPSTTLEIWSGILNHVDEVAAETVVGFHVSPPVWDKWVGDVAWHPDLAVDVRTWDLLTVTDVISSHSGVAIVEHWNPEHLQLAEYVREPDVGVVLSDTGFLSWEFPEGMPGTITLTKVYQVQPCTWSYTVLWEELWLGEFEWERRPVHLEGWPSVYLPLVVRNYQP